MENIVDDYCTKLHKSKSGTVAGELLCAAALKSCRNEPDWLAASELLKRIKAEKK